MGTIDRIEIRHPCSASWAEMDGDARSRFCTLCSKVVHDTTALTTCELEKMLDAPTVPCLRVHRDAGGRVLTRDRLAALAFVGLAACAGGSDSSAIATSPSPDVATEVRTMGTGTREDGASGIAELVVAPPRPTQGEPGITAGVVALLPSPPEALVGRVAPHQPDPMPLMGAPLANP
jgi:hypothetical protein